MKTSTFIKRRASVILTAIFIMAFGVYFLLNTEDFKPLLAISLYTLLAIAFLQVLFQIVNGIFLKLSAEIFIKKMSFIEGVFVTVLSSVANFFGPLLGGASVRAVYLKKVHNLPYSKFTSTLIGYYVIFFFLSSCLALAALFSIGSQDYMWLKLFFGGWAGFLAILMFVRLPEREKLHGLENRSKIWRFIIASIYDIEAGWKTITRSGVLLLKLTILAVASIVIMLLITHLEISAIGARVSFAGLSLYVALSVASILVSITPAGIGIRESILLITSSAIGLSGDQILQIAVIDRGVSFFVLGILYIAAQLIKTRGKIRGI